MFMVSQFVYTLQISSEFNLAEEKAFELLRRIILKQGLKREAAALINSWWRVVKIKRHMRSENSFNTQVKSQIKALGLSKKLARQRTVLNFFAEEIFEKKLDNFRKERQRMQRKGIPLSENLMKINQLVETHLKELNAAMHIFRCKSSFLISQL